MEGNRNFWNDQEKYLPLAFPPFQNLHLHIAPIHSYHNTAHNNKVCSLCFLFLNFSPFNPLSDIRNLCSLFHYFNLCLFCFPSPIQILFNLKNCFRSCLSHCVSFHILPLILLVCANLGEQSTQYFFLFVFKVLTNCFFPEP